MDYIKHMLKILFSFFVYYTGLIKLFDIYLRHKKYGHVTIFVGHRVIDDSERFNGINQMYVDWGHAMLLSDFKQRLQYLKKRYRIVSLDEAMEKIRTGSLSERLIVLTFDDGYIDCKTVILSTVMMMEVPVTFFLSPGFIGNNIPWWDRIVHYIYYSKHREIIVQDLGKTNISLSSYKYKLDALHKLSDFISKADADMKDRVCNEIQERTGTSHLEMTNLYLTWNDVSILVQEPLCTIGAHTTNHPNLCVLSENDIVDEINSSKETLEKAVQKEVKYFSYPHGYYNKKVRDILAESGYESAFAVENGRYDDFFAFRRVNICTTFPVFAVESAGLIEYLRAKIQFGKSQR